MSQPIIQFEKTYHITGKIRLLTGLHIGAGRDAIEIGGIDNPVIRHPHTLQPYIPGSSLKGKLRSLLEWALHKVEPDGSAWGSRKQSEITPDDPILRAFGTTHDNWQYGPTRLIVRDAHLSADWVKLVNERGWPLSEEKTEVSIDRIQGKANHGGPHRLERVPAGALFDLDISFRAFSLDGDAGKDIEALNRVLEALKLLEHDYLGGSGSRGSGRVRIEDLKVDGQAIQAAFDQMPAVSPETPNRLFPPRV